MATTVLPEPTSPCSKRFIGWPAARSRRISAMTFRCAPVSSNGSDSKNLSSNAPDPHCAQARLAKDNNALAGRDHFLYVMQVEPSAHERLAQSICLRLLQRGFKNFFPSAKTAQRSLNHLAAKTDRNIAFLARKTRELG